MNNFEKINRALAAKKRTLLIVLLAMTGMVGFAQHHTEHHGDRGPQGHERHEHHGRHIECATPEQMNMSLHVIGGQSFDDKKLEIAKLCVTLGHFCVDDLARMAVLFSFDDSRLAFLQYAYPYCQDPQNYYVLRDVFSFKSNFDTLMDSVQPVHRR